jgi:hypothetical protein
VWPMRHWRRCSFALQDRLAQRQAIEQSSSGSGSSSNAGCTVTQVCVCASKKASLPAAAAAAAAAGPMRSGLMFVVCQSGMAAPSRNSLPVTLTCSITVHTPCTRGCRCWPATAHVVSASASCRGMGCWW